MAFVQAFEPSDRVGVRLQPTKVVCKYRFERTGGLTLLQLDTHGSTDRDIPGKLSQTLQIDANGAKALIAILREAFDLK